MIDLPDYLEDEWFVVRYSGEIPEIAYHSSIYYLTEAPEGPGLELDKRDYALLKEAAKERFREIILRDLLPENRDSSIYRGIKRSIINYGRFQSFCQRQGLDEHGYAAEVASSLLAFLESELRDVTQGLRNSVINCSYCDLKKFAVKIGLGNEVECEAFALLCPAEI